MAQHRISLVLPQNEGHPQDEPTPSEQDAEPLQEISDLLGLPRDYFGNISRAAGTDQATAECGKASEIDRLVAAFARISSDSLRMSVVTLVERLAAGPDQSSTTSLPLPSGDAPRHAAESRSPLA